jgi:hypothetical protein
MLARLDNRLLWQLQRVDSRTLWRWMMLLDHYVPKGGKYTMTAVEVL